MSIIALDAAHNFLELVAQISRAKNDRALTVDLKSGYLISTGTWTRTSDGEIKVSSRVVDSYKYFQVGAGKPDGESSRTWTISGEQLGPVKRTLTRDGQVFEPSKKFRSGGRVLEFWSQFVSRK